MSIEIKKSGVIFFLLFAIVFTSFSNISAHPIASVSRQDDLNTYVEKGINYIASQMNEDGGIRWMDETSDVPTTIKVVIALAANGYPQDHLISQNGNRPIDFLINAGYEWVFQTGSDNPGFNTARAGQLLTAVSAANENPHSFGDEGIDLIAEIKNHYDLNTGIIGAATPQNVTDQVWAILGLAASYASIPEESTSWLANAQLEDGSWDDGYGSYLDVTPLAIMALVASGDGSTYEEQLQKSISFLKTNQQANDGWQTQWDSTTNANTTGVILQAIYALGQQSTGELWVQDGGTTIDALLELQQADGAIGGDFANTYSTADTLIGISGEPLFNLSRVRRLNLAIDFIKASQSQDGGWGSVGQTVDIMLALKAAGWNPNTMTAGEQTPLDYVAANLEEYTKSGPDAIGKIILGLVAAGADPTNFADRDLVAELLAAYDPSLKAFGVPDNTWHQALSILGLSAAETPPPQEAVETLIGLQQADGGWEYAPGFGTAPDNTALAIQAIVTSGLGLDNRAIQDALAYLKLKQAPDGGWGDSSSIAFALMAINALGASGQDWATTAGKTPESALFNFQKPNGAFFFNPEFTDDNLMSTATAIIASLNANYIVSDESYSQENQAGLVIDPGDQPWQTACISFTSDTLTGAELLERSGFDYQSDSGFIISIMDISNQDGETNYWSYWHWDGREWVFNNSGASDTEVPAGAIQAWHFTSWEQFPSLPPDGIPNLIEICGQLTLKNYNEMPYINYADITKQTSEQPSKPIEETQTPTIITGAPGEHITLTTTPEAPSDQPSMLPILIIAGGGLLLLGLFFYFRKRA